MRAIMTIEELTKNKKEEKCEYGLRHKLWFLGTEVINCDNGSWDCKKYQCEKCLRIYFEKIGEQIDGSY